MKRRATLALALALAALPAPAQTVATLVVASEEWLTAAQAAALGFSPASGFLASGLYRAQVTCAGKPAAVASYTGADTPEAQAAARTAALALVRASFLPSGVDCQ